MRSHKCKEGVFESFFLSCVWKLAPDEHTHDVNTAVFPREHNQHRKKCVCDSFIAYESLLQLVVKFRAGLCTSSAIFRHSWGISFSILARFAQCWGSLWAFSWRYVGTDRGPWGLDQGYVEGFAAVMLLVLWPCWSIWLLFLCCLTWAGGLCVVRVKHKNTWKMRSDKCKKGLGSFLCRFCCFVLWKLAPVGGQIRGTFVPIFGDLGAFLGHILFHIGALHPMLGRLLVEVCWKWLGAVGSRSGLCWRLCCCYVTCFAAMLVHLAAFSLLFDLGRWSFAQCVWNTKKHEKWGPTSEERWFWPFSLSFLLLCLMKASSSGCPNSGHVCANLRRSSGIPGAYPSPGAQSSLWAYVEGFAAVMLLVLRPCWSTWLLFLCPVWLGRWSFAYCA